MVSQCRHTDYTPFYFGSFAFLQEARRFTKGKSYLVKLGTPKGFSPGHKLFNNQISSGAQINLDFADFFYAG